MKTDGILLLAAGLVLGYFYGLATAKALPGATRTSLEGDNLLVRVDLGDAAAGGLAELLRLSGRASIGL
jgi:hypothetical protein